MRIVTFNNKGSGHLFNEKKGMTACGKKWPGPNGELEIREPQAADYSNDRKLHLCGNCEKVITSAGSTMYWRFVQ